MGRSRAMAGTVLIVEDDRELQELYAAMLEEFDCRIIQAYDGEEAWQKLQTTTPDLILLDIILGETMGDGLFARVKGDRRYKGIPIVVVSVLSASSKQCRRMLEIDPNVVFLRKPFQKAQLLDQVRAYLSGNR
jgi:DNA-binding response OmpR family regulator